MSNVLVGADPELFVLDMSSRHITPIIGKLGGTKDAPLPLAFEGFGLQEDNCAAEFNIPAASSSVDFINSINYALAAIRERIKKHNLDLAPGIASVSFELEQVADKPEAWVFGCEPDYNAYTGRKNPKPQCDDFLLRSAGGHVHVGFKNNPSKEEAHNVMRAMDVFTGLESVILDSDTRRRQLYGKAGAFRYKKYGAEYRTLSNFWIFDDKIMENVYNNTQKAVKFAEQNFLDPASSFCKSVVEAINTGNRDLASSILHEIPEARFVL